MMQHVTNPKPTLAKPPTKQSVPSPEPVKQKLDADTFLRYWLIATLYCLAHAASLVIAGLILGLLLRYYVHSSLKEFNQRLARELQTQATQQVQAQHPFPFEK